MAAAVSSAAGNGDPLAAALVAAHTEELRERISSVAALRRASVASATLCEHLDTGRRATDSVAAAIYCATIADGADEALRVGVRAGGRNAVAALTGAIAGARFGARALPEDMAVSPVLRERIEQLAARLASGRP
jgi:ADP-ribosyl-[dinitrogen reductase] hydrolase